MTELTAYSDLPTREASKVQRLTEQAQQIEGDITERIIKLGEKFRQIQHVYSENGRGGKFSAWIRECTNVSKRTVYNYIQVAGVFGNCATVAHFSVRALVLLSQDTCPEDATEDAIKASKKLCRGQVIDEEQAREFIDAYTVEGGIEDEEEEEAEEITPAVGNATVPRSADLVSPPAGDESEDGPYEDETDHEETGGAVVSATAGHEAQVSYRPCPHCGGSGQLPDQDFDTVWKFPCQGKPDEWAVTANQLADWEDAYPGLDVIQELNKAREWIKATPKNRKTARGMPKFLVNWLNRASDAPRRNGAPQLTKQQQRVANNAEIARRWLEKGS